MAFPKQLLFLFLISFSILLSQVSSPGNDEEASSSKNNDCYKLKSTVSSLQSIIKEKNQELLTKEEKIQGLELFILEKFYLCESDIDLSQYASEAEEKNFKLRREVEMQLKRRLAVKIQAETADEKVADISLKRENIDGKWLLSKLGLNLNKTQTYLMTLWHQHLSPTLQKKWIPSIKPKFQYIIDKSIEVLYTATQALTPDLIPGYDVSYYYLEVNRIMTTVKLYLEKGQVFLESCTEIVIHGFNKLVNLRRKK